MPIKLFGVREKLCFTFRLFRWSYQWPGMEALACQELLSFWVTYSDTVTRSTVESIKPWNLLPDSLLSCLLFPSPLQTIRNYVLLSKRWISLVCFFQGHTFIYFFTPCNLPSRSLIHCRIFTWKANFLMLVLICVLKNANGKKQAFMYKEAVGRSVLCGQTFISLIPERLSTLKMVLGFYSFIDQRIILFSFFIFWNLIMTPLMPISNNKLEFRKLEN